MGLRRQKTFASPRRCAPAGSLRPSAVGAPFQPFFSSGHHSSWKGNRELSHPTRVLLRPFAKTSEFINGERSGNLLIRQSSNADEQTISPNGEHGVRLRRIPAKLTHTPSPCGSAPPLGSQKPPPEVFGAKEIGVLAKPKASVAQRRDLRPSFWSPRCGVPPG